MSKSRLVEAVARLHQEVDGAAATVAQVHRKRLQCKAGCNSCCVDDISVFEVEADLIRARHAELLRTQTPSPEGQCAFLSQDGLCRIYAERPYVCRTQGLPLRWCEEGPEGILEFRDICALNEAEGPPLVELNADQCWTLGTYEGRLAQLESERAGGGLRRVRLRDLFAGACPEKTSR